MFYQKDGQPLLKKLDFGNFQKGTLLRRKKSCIKFTALENDLQGLFCKKTNLEKMGIFLPK